MAEETKESAEASAEQDNNAEVNPEQAVGLQINDLKVFAQLIEVTSGRGAIRPNEMNIVGAAYDRLITFLRANGAIEPAPEEEKPAEAEETETKE
tara:strand:- start:169 stop:453 length:285 start_codon:yes stop_codon:yes gene_type:complete